MTSGHTTEEWLRILNGRLLIMETLNYDGKEVLRAHVLKMAAVCVAWLETGNLK